MKKQEQKPEDHLQPDEPRIEEAQDHKIELIQCEPVAQDKEAASDPKDAKTVNKTIDPSKLFRKLMIKSAALKK